MSDRDRDSEGRAHSARSRDAYGRPLPRGAAGEPTVSDEQAAELARDPTAALAEAQRLLDTDHPFHAHEVLEAVWKSAPDQERQLWRGLAQLAVGLTHLRRGNPVGARALLSRAADHVAEYADDDPAAEPLYGLDLPVIVTDVRTLITRIDDQDTDVSTARLVLVAQG